MDVPVLCIAFAAVAFRYLARTSTLSLGEDEKRPKHTYTSHAERKEPSFALYIYLRVCNEGKLVYKKRTAFSGELYPVV